MVVDVVVAGRRRTSRRTSLQILLHCWCLGVVVGLEPGAYSVKNKK